MPGGGVEPPDNDNSVALPLRQLRNLRIQSTLRCPGNGGTQLECPTSLPQASASALAALADEPVGCGLASGHVEEGRDECWRAGKQHIQQNAEGGGMGLVDCELAPCGVVSKTWQNEFMSTTRSVRQHEQIRRAANSVRRA